MLLVADHTFSVKESANSPISRLRVSCQVKKNPKIREKLGLVRLHPPTRLYNFLDFLETIRNMKTTQKMTQSFKKNLKSELGLDPPTHFFTFSRIFFNLTKPLSNLMS